MKTEDMAVGPTKKLPRGGLHEKVASSSIGEVQTSAAWERVSASWPSRAKEGPIVRRPPRFRFDSEWVARGLTEAAKKDAEDAGGARGRLLEHRCDCPRRRRDSFLTTP